jgi:hypothetical protein
LHPTGPGGGKVQQVCGVLSHRGHYVVLGKLPAISEQLSVGKGKKY